MPRDLVEALRGSAQVERLSRFWCCWRPTIISLQETTEAIAEKRYALLKQLPARFLYDVDEPTLLTAGRFKARHRLSLADALIAAFAVREEAILVHKDPVFESLSKQVKQETLANK